MRISLLLILLTLSLVAKVDIAVSYPYIGALVEAVGQDRVNVSVLAKGNWDPHFVVPRPSLISKVRNADALIINGAQLEIGWVPPLIKRAGNRKLSQGAFLDLSTKIRLIDRAHDISRSGGDVHPDGNPHFHLDPHNIPLLASAIARFLSKLDTEGKGYYDSNLQTFDLAWQKDLEKWDARMAQAKGREVVQYHTVFNYFLQAYGIDSIGTIEPLPGVAPSSRHSMRLIDMMKEKRPCCILHDVYHPTKTAEFIAQKSGIRLVIVPHDIGALNDIESLEALFTYLVEAAADD